MSIVSVLCLMVQRFYFSLRMVPTKYGHFCAKLEPCAKKQIFAKAIGIQKEKIGVATHFAR